MTEKHAKNNVRWHVFTTPNLNCCLSSSNEIKTYLILCIFFQEKHTFPELCSYHQSSHLQHWLTYLITLKRDRLGEDSSYTQPYYFPWYTYVSHKANRVGHIICHFSHHMNVPCCKFEKILNKHSKLNYIHTLRSFRVITWIKLRVDIFGKVD